MFPRVACLLLPSVLAGCAIDPAQVRETLKLKANCGAFRAESATTYQLAPFDLQIANSVVVPSIDKALTEEARVQLAQAIRAFLQSDWKLRESKDPEPLVSWAGFSGTTLWLQKHGGPPCGATLPVRPRSKDDADIVILLQVRSNQEPAYAWALGMALLVLSGGRAIGSSPMDAEDVARDKLRYNYLAVGMVDARTGEILRVSTVPLEKEDRPQIPEHASRLVRRVFSGQ
jgi:hypothetical protein